MMPHFAGSQKTYDTLKKFNLPMNADGTFKAIMYDYENFKHVSTRVLANPCAC